MLRAQAEKLFPTYEAEIGQTAKANAARVCGIDFSTDFSTRGHAMSAALTLPYVWATSESIQRRHKAGGHAPEGMAFYRKRTECLLRRYCRASLAVGRVPSVASDITLRGRASSYRLKNFEDVVIFAIDVERCLKLLEPQALEVVVKVAIQEFVMMEVAQQMRLDCRMVARKYGEALDRLSVEFLKKKLLDRED